MLHAAEVARLMLPCAALAWSMSAAGPSPSTLEVHAPVVHSLNHHDLEAFFDGIIPLQLERSDVAGATVLVMRGSETLLQKGYGFTDVKAKRAVAPISSRFRLASISKLFTWTAAMQLVEQGKLELDANVDRYLDFPIGGAQPIALRNLMTIRTRSVGILDARGLPVDRHQRLVQSLAARGTTLRFSKLPAQRAAQPGRLECIAQDNDHLLASAAVGIRGVVQPLR